MNLLNNKDILRGLLQQGDILNTINGGVSRTSVKTKQMEDHFLITISAPSVSPDAFNVVINHNQLVAFSVIKELNRQNETASAWNLPMFYNTFNIPQYVDKEAIEAVHEEGELKIILPFKEFSENTWRKIDIKHLR